uniref:Csu type fimbrial protein n=1 Tax=uncultured Halomonas sp. TaxID=173971 RepID=UPI00261CBC51|nr:spore coat U domain-containing protein [uncultured Halomonas sp.]
MAAAASLMFSTPALAATDTTSFQVTATVNDSCRVTAEDLAFGIYDPNTANDRDAESTITATCTEGTNYDIELNAGGNATDASSTSRAMVGGTSGAYLDYELYSDAGRSTVWNDTNMVNNSSATGGDNPHTVYGQIPGGQFVPAESYSDTINVTITY